MEDCFGGRENLFFEDESASKKAELVRSDEPRNHPIIDRTTNQLVDAVLHTNLEAVRLVDAEIDWMPERLRVLRFHIAQRTPMELIPEHVTWNWGYKVLQTRFLAFRSLAIEKEGKIQGLMMVDLTNYAARLPPDTEKPLHVDHIESAPLDL